MIKITQGTIDVRHFMASNYIRTVFAKTDWNRTMWRAMAIEVGRVSQSSSHQQSVSHNISFKDLGSFLTPDTCDIPLKDYNSNHNDRASDMHHDSYLLLGILVCQVGFILPACLCAVGEHFLSSRVVIIHKQKCPSLCGQVRPRLPLRSQGHPDSDKGQQQHCPVHRGFGGVEKK